MDQVIKDFKDVYFETYEEKLTYTMLARMLGVSKKTVESWSSPDRSVPKYIKNHIALMQMVCDQYDLEGFYFRY